MEAKTEPEMAPLVMSIDGKLVPQEMPVIGKNTCIIKNQGAGAMHYEFGPARGKHVYIVNGAGGSGKDTFCGTVNAAFPCRVMTISSVDIVKEAAKLFGWNGRKSDRDRKFLSDLKMLASEYNNAPEQYQLDMLNKFIVDPELEIMLVHIRECDQINKFYQSARARLYQSCAELPWSIGSVLVVRAATDRSFGNVADDHVKDREYGICLENNGTVEDFQNLIRTTFIPDLTKILTGGEAE